MLDFNDLISSLVQPSPSWTIRINKLDAIKLKMEAFGLLKSLMKQENKHSF